MLEKLFPLPIETINFKLDRAMIKRVQDVYGYIYNGKNVLEYVGLHYFSLYTLFD